jgi:hypothetical protein
MSVREGTRQAVVTSVLTRCVVIFFLTEITKAFILLKTRNNKSIKDSMEEINEINNNNNDDDNGDSGNNNRGVAVVNRFHYLAVRTPYFVARTFAKEAYRKVVLRFSRATIRFLKWKIKNEREKITLRIEEKNATIRFSKWRIPKVEGDLEDARRSFRDEKQSNEKKDGHIQLVTVQKRQHIQTMRRLKKEANAAKVKVVQASSRYN